MLYFFLAPQTMTGAVYVSSLSQIWMCERRVGPSPIHIFHLDTQTLETGSVDPVVRATSFSSREDAVKEDLLILA